MKKVMLFAMFAGAVMFFAAGCCGTGRSCDKAASDCPVKATCPVKDRKQCPKGAKACPADAKACAARKASKACPCGDKCPGADCTACATAAAK